jgi:HSP20 family protein
MILVKSFNGRILVSLLVLVLLGGNAYGSMRILGMDEGNVQTVMGDSFDKFDRLTEQFFNNALSIAGDFGTTFRIDVQDNKDEYVVEAELPGIDKDSINLSYENSNIIINVYNNKEVKEEDKNYIKKERNFKAMTRALYLPNVVEDKISAKLDNGILTIHLPKDKKATKINTIKID